MKNLLLIPFFLLMLSGCSHEPDVYIFSYFQRNGEDGLHSAYSEDGFNWTALNNNNSFLKPEAGQDKLMRDPCIIKGVHKIDGEYVMFLKDETLLPEAEKNIRIATSSSLTSGYSTASKAITDNWVEGPTTKRIDGNWVVYFDRYK